MKVIPLSIYLFKIVQNNNGLSVYLKNLARGRAETPRSKLYEDKAPEAILADWLKQLATVKTGPFGDKIYHFDTSQLKKWGPQGKIAPIDELMPLIEAAYADNPSINAFYSTREWKQAKERAIKYLIKDLNIYHKLSPRAYPKVVDDMSARDTLESNSGFDQFTKRSKPEVIAHAIELAQSGGWKYLPAIALFRNYNQKTRLVWMFPMSANLVEGSFTQVLKQQLQDSDLRFLAPWRGYSDVLSNISSYYGRGEFLSASDFSSTDSHFTLSTTMQVYDVIKHAFQPKYWDLLKESLTYMHKIPLVIGPDKMVVGLHGVSSGSNWTNDVETYFDFILSQYLTIIGVVSEPGMAIGDDMLHRNRQFNSNLPNQLENAGRLVGQDINAEKTTNQRDEVKFLQRLTIRGYNSDRYYTRNGTQYRQLRGIYSTVRALKSSVFPEKFHNPKLWSKDMHAVRQVMILENCVDHPLFVQFVKFIAKGNRYLIEFACKKSSEIDKIQESSKVLPGLNPTYNQEKRDSKLSSFETIRVLRTLA